MILITGGSGFLGTALVNSLLEKGHSIKALDRNVTMPIKGVEYIKADITQPSTLKPIKGIDTVIHLAGVVSYSKPRQEIMRINYEGTKNILNICKDVGKFVFASSVSVYGPITGIADEGHKLGPINPYGESKLAAEKEILSSGLPYIIFRFAPVYGKGSPSWIKNLKLLEKGFPIPKTNNLTHILHLDNLLQALELSVETKRKSEIYNIADNKPVKFMYFAEELVRLLGCEPKTMPMWLVKLGARMKGLGPYLDVLTMNRNYNIEKARDRLGYKPVENFEKNLKEMVDWYKSL